MWAIRMAFCDRLAGSVSPRLRRPCTGVRQRAARIGFQPASSRRRSTAPTMRTPSRLPRHQLRRMTDPSPDTNYALVVPSSSMFHALRVQPPVQGLLRISVKLSVGDVCIGAWFRGSTLRLANQSLSTSYGLDVCGCDWGPTTELTRKQRRLDRHEPARTPRHLDGNGKGSSHTTRGRGRTPRRYSLSHPWRRNAPQATGRGRRTTNSFRQQSTAPRRHLTTVPTSRAAATKLVAAEVEAMVRGPRGPATSWRPRQSGTACPRSGRQMPNGETSGIPSAISSSLRLSQPPPGTRQSPRYTTPLAVTPRSVAHAPAAAPWPESPSAGHGRRCAGSGRDSAAGRAPQ